MNKPDLALNYNGCYAIKRNKTKPNQSVYLSDQSGGAIEYTDCISAEDKDP